MIDYDDATLAQYVADRPECLEVLSARERQVLIARISGSVQAKTIQESGRELGISRERVRQLEQQAREKIRRFRQDDAAKCLHCNGSGWMRKNQ